MLTNMFFYSTASKRTLLHMTSTDPPGFMFVMLAIAKYIMVIPTHPHCGRVAPDEKLKINKLGPYKIKIFTASLQTRVGWTLIIPLVS